MELDGVEAEQCVGALVEQVAHPPRRLHVFDHGTDIDDGLGGQPRHGRAPDVFDADHLLADHLPHALALALEPVGPLRVALDDLDSGGHCRAHAAGRKVSSG